VLFLVRPAHGGVPSHGSLLNNLTDSLNYIRSNEVFAKVIATAVLNATLAMGYLHMLPVFAKDVLEVDARGLGFLTSAAGIGALTGMLSYAWLQLRMSPRNLMVGALTVYNVALIGLAFSDWYWLSFCAILVAGRPDADTATRIIGFFAVVLGTANVVGGYVVTDRMLEMFKRRPDAKP